MLSRIRWLFAFIAVLIFLGSLRYLRQRIRPWIDPGPVTGSPFIYKGPDAQDKVIVMAKIANQTVDWAFEGLKELVIPGMVHHAGLTLNQ
jgi:hypothetical protein